MSINNENLWCWICHPLYSFHSLEPNTFLFMFIIIGFVMAYLVYRISNKWKKLDIKNYLVIAMWAVLGFFLCFISPFRPDLKEAMKNIIDCLSAFGPTITALLVAWISVWQFDLQRKQHNLALYEKRWDFWEETKKLGNEAQSFKHIFCEDIKDDNNENYHTISNKIKSLANRSTILFGKEVEKNFLDIVDSFEKLHQIDDKILLNLKYKDSYNSMGRNITKENIELHNNKLKLSPLHIKQWDILAEKIFAKIKELDV
ncbi:MAG: hypothetical protein MSS98_06185 [Alphaproteobacteria bacterium]|nr:hypothetical protein [Alphaproteobacteria bacterium]